MGEIKIQESNMDNNGIILKILDSKTLIVNRSIPIRISIAEWFNKTIEIRIIDSEEPLAKAESSDELILLEISIPSKEGEGLAAIPNMIDKKDNSGLFFTFYIKTFSDSNALIVLNFSKGDFK